jgi:hypothetical protein
MPVRSLYYCIQSRNKNNSNVTYKHENDYVINGWAFRKYAWKPGYQVSGKERYCL